MNMAASSYASARLAATTSAPPLSSPAEALLRSLISAAASLEATCVAARAVVSYGVAAQWSRAPQRAEAGAAGGGGRLPTAFVAALFFATFRTSLLKMAENLKMPGAT